MIIKIKSHKREIFKQILEYMLHNINKISNERKNTFTLTHNLKGKTIETWVKQLKENEQLRLYKRKDSVRLTHEILSWHKEDAKNIDLPKMEAMTREYFLRRNPKGIYVAVPHFDKDHFHIHVLASGVEFRTGKSLRLSKVEFQNLKKRFQDYHQKYFPELTKSIVRHGSKNIVGRSDKEYQFKLRTGKQSDKETLISILDSCYKKANSKEMFLDLLHNNGIKTYKRAEQTTGVLYKGSKFRFNRLGYTKDRLEHLQKISNRDQLLANSRESTLRKLRENRAR